MNETANATLALGALPVMAHAQEEVEELASVAGALVLNIGTLSEYWIESMLLAAKAANRVGVPVVLDPVGAGATKFRTETARRILAETEIAVVRGNAAEVATIAGRQAEIRGVESIGATDSGAELAQAAARKLGCVAAVTGAIDHVSDGERVIAISNGHELLSTVSGTGCMSTAVTGSFLAAKPTEPLEAAAAGPPGTEREAVAAASGRKIGVSPIVAGRALKGPTDRMLASLGHEVSALGVARLYSGLLDQYVLDEADAELAPGVAGLGMQPLVAQTVMKTDADRAALARFLIDAASG